MAAQLAQEKETFRIAQSNVAQELQTLSSNLITEKKDKVSAQHYVFVNERLERQMKQLTKEKEEISKSKENADYLTQRLEQRVRELTAVKETQSQLCDELSDSLSNEKKRSIEMKGRIDVLEEELYKMTQQCETLKKKYDVVTHDLWKARIQKRGTVFNRGFKFIG